VNVRAELRRHGYWLEPRVHDPGWLAFALNRLTGLILFLYLVAHLVVLSRLAGGAAGWDELLGIFGSRPFLVGDVLLIAAVVYHGLNGIRVVLLTAGIGIRHEVASFGLVFATSAVLTLLAGWAILS